MRKSLISLSLIMGLGMPQIVRAESSGSAAAAGVVAIVFFFISMLFVLAWFAFVAFMMIYWILMIIDCIKRDNWESENDKVLWILIILLAGIIGALIYRFVVVSKLGKAGKTTEVQVVKSKPSTKKK